MNLLEQLIEWFLSLFQHGGGTVHIDSGGTPDPSEPGTPIGNRHAVTEPENPTAHFFSTGSAAWANQVFTVNGKTYRGIHGGTDFAAPSGSTVYAPYTMKIIAIAYYADEGRKGWYVIGTLPDGAEYYSGHLNNIAVKRGETVPSGTPIGTTWDWWGDAGRPHTHIQIKVRGEVTDPEAYFRSHA